MKKSILSIWIIACLLTINSCDQNNRDSLDKKDYEKAAEHLSKNLNKHLQKIVNYQKWENEDFLFYKVKEKTKSKSFKINLQTNQVSLVADQNTKNTYTK